jgi:hypothetical protein
MNECLPGTLRLPKMITQAAEAGSDRENCVRMRGHLRSVTAETLTRLSM